MIPQHFVELAAVPLLPNGKVDRKALLAPDIAEVSEHALFKAPTTEAEMAVAEIWQRLLAVDRISVTDNFFDLGGHSLLAMKGVIEMEQRLGTRVNVRRLIFESLGKLAATASSIAADDSGQPAQVENAALNAKSKGWLARVVATLRQ